jgi:hypothetical protein
MKCCWSRIHPYLRPFRETAARRETVPRTETRGFESFFQALPQQGRSPPRR